MKFPVPSKSSWQYFNASVACSTQVILGNIADFIRYAELHQLRSVFLLHDAIDPSGLATHFAVLHNGSLIQQATQGFRAIEDYVQATKGAFPDAGSYYDAQARGLSKYADYQLMCEAGIAEAETVETMKREGYIAGYEAWQILKEKGELEVPDIGPVSNAHELYQWAKKRGFPDYTALEQALVLGFSDWGDYQAATAKGFTNAARYEDAVRRGFLNNEDYEFALGRQIRDAADARTFFDLQAGAGGPDMEFDKKVLLTFLSRLEEGKRVSINKIEQHFTKALDDYRYADTGQLPPWFTIGIQGRDELIAFLSRNEEVKQYGDYDNDGEFFEVAPLKGRHVVLDASNVAYNSASRKEAKPFVANILKVVRFLRAKGFEQISIIADASLCYRLADTEKLEELKEASEYIEAPAEKSADQFIIQYVKNNNCLLVSNDTFREWKAQDPWVASNIDYYRLSFLVKGDEVLMPDLEAMGSK
jgi:hypothetical protein